MFKTPHFYEKMEFFDVKELIYILSKSKENGFVGNSTLKSIFEKNFEKYEEVLILEEVFMVIPIAAQLSGIFDDIVPPLLKKATVLIKEKEVTLELILMICRSLNHLGYPIIFNQLTRAATKEFWKACQKHLFTLVLSVEPTTKKRRNPFLEVTYPKKDKEAMYINEMLSERDLTILNEVFGNVVSWNLGTQKFFDAFYLIYTRYFDNYKESGLPRIAYSLAEMNIPRQGFANKLEAHLIETKDCGSPIDALFYAWFFAIKNNYNQELWNVIMNDLGKLDTIENVPIKYLMHLYEVLFSIKVEKSYVNIENLTKFIDKLDEIWENNHVLVESKFKGVIHSIIEEESFKLEHKVRASLYQVDYMYHGKEVVLVLGNESYLADSSRLLGHVELRKRLLTKLGFNLRIINKKEYLEQKKIYPKVEYVKKQLKGIPRDQKKWKEMRDMKPNNNKESKDKDESNKNE